MIPSNLNVQNRQLDRESKLVVASAVVSGDKCGMAVNKFGISSWGDENVWKLMMMMFSQLYKYTENNQIVCFKWIIGI